jgi:hypothetical protein
VTLCATIQTNRETLGAGEYVFVRRYSDFKWLHEALQRVNTFYIVPPIPGKKLLCELSRHRLRANE